ncbi:hypothetical protein KNO15_21210 [Leifsonia shinshuensis]|uniref:hypothetical protein n=1 Tax=Leifsonia shinshuensis TaxID=150026 RepID=UPI001F510E54|nr:hypothetical protein [Leifsonia shinshuensis]MCI0159229.1 hypothetical protein [Leifsonia shinshuensis]
MRKKLFGGLVALALALAPAAGANAAPYPPGAGDALHGTLNSLVGAPGDTITYSADANTYAAEEALTQKIRGLEAHAIGLASTKAAPATEGTFSKPAAADGSHTFSFTIPMTAQHGDQYEVDVILASGDVWDHFVVTTVVRGAGNGSGPDAGSGSGSDSAAGSGSDGGLAMTGSDIAIAGIATGAVLLFVGGLVLLIVRRRRSRADAAA